MSKDLSAQLAKYAAGFANSDTSERKRREKQIAMSPDDGRRRPRAPRTRTKQLNLLITPDLHRRMLEASHARGVTLTALLEAAVEAYLRKGERA